MTTWMFFGVLTFEQRLLRVICRYSIALARSLITCLPSVAMAPRTTRTSSAKPKPTANAKTAGSKAKAGQGLQGKETSSKPRSNKAGGPSNTSDEFMEGMKKMLKLRYPDLGDARIKEMALEFSANAEKAAEPDENRQQSTCPISIFWKYDTILSQRYRRRMPP